MKEITGDLWELASDAICITTNGTVRNGENIMGGGCAFEAATKFPGLPREYGRLIESHGHHVYPMRGDLIMFPTKRRVQDRASLTLVMQSCYELMILADVYEWENILLPRPGCGLGGLKWGMVRNVIKHILDDRVTVVGYPGEE